MTCFMHINLTLYNDCLILETSVNMVKACCVSLICIVLSNPILQLFCAVLI